MYTGKTEQPCCLCDDPDTAVRLDLPPRAVPEMKHADAIAWQDIVGEVSIHFCASDWELVRDLVLDIGKSPLPRCNVARASFDLREDFEALLDDVRDEPDHGPVERRMLAESEETLAADAPEDPALVQALLVQWTLADSARAAANGED